MGRGSSVAQFKDHFSGHSADYAKYRPGYPDALFAWAAALVESPDLAWDVGTGSGQAAVGLARHFQRVIASDAARAQVLSAVAHARVEYKVMPAEQSDFADASVDLVAVAQALHWFDHDRFFAEVKRVLKPRGAIVVWTYGLTKVSREVDAVIEGYYRDIVGAYWPPDRIHVDSGYRTLPFPFAEIQAPRFMMSASWRLEEFFGYLDTWSAAKRYATEHKTNPLDLIRDALGRAWGEQMHARRVTWPLAVRAGRVSSA